MGCSLAPPRPDRLTSTPVFSSLFSFGHSLALCARAVLLSAAVDFLGVGAALATAGWGVANGALRGGPARGDGGRGAAAPPPSPPPAVEWLYAFDVHCNAYFPLFLELYGEFLGLKNGISGSKVGLGAG